MNADAQIEDLKDQLDDALGAEEMLVQLTDRNLMLSEVCISVSAVIQKQVSAIVLTGKLTRLD